MNKIPIISFMTAWNEADYIEYAVRSTINHVDLMIIIEGAFEETVETGGSLRSTDGTLEILSKLEHEFGPKILISKLPGPVSQLDQRNFFFVLMKLVKLINYDYWMVIQDSDEIYDEENFNKLKRILNDTQADVIKIDSLTFVNDFKHFVKIAFPRCFRIRFKYDYRFCGPNHLAYRHPDAVRDVGWQALGPEENHEDSVRFFHYSYVKSSERFIQKKKEREHIHGSFKWSLDDKNKVMCPGTNIRTFEGKHPEIMKNHPLAESKGLI